MEVRTAIVSPGGVQEALEACRRRHEVLYTGHGYARSFHGYVARGMQAFLEAYDPTQDCIWRALRGDAVLGYVAIQHTSDAQWSQLRWFLVEPQARGQGVGARLLQDALDFAQRAGRRGVFLWTVSDLAAARRLYEHAGFRCIEEHAEPCPWAPWGHEQRWALEFAR